MRRDSYPSIVGNSNVANLQRHHGSPPYLCALQRTRSHARSCARFPWLQVKKKTKSKRISLKVQHKVKAKVRSRHVRSGAARVRSTTTDLCSVVPYGRSLSTTASSVRKPNDTPSERRSCQRIPAFPICTRSRRS